MRRPDESPPPGRATRVKLALGALVPVAVALHFAHASQALVFIASALAVIPAAAAMSEATEQLALRAGPGVGGLVNVTFGNAAELIIALFALGHGLHEVVKASLVGSVIGNSLLVLGAAMLAGGVRRRTQTFSRTFAQNQAGMLLIAVTALVLPAVYELAHGAGLPRVGAVRVSSGHDLRAITFGVALIMLMTYSAGLLFSLRTHRDLLDPTGASADEPPTMSARRALATLAIAAAVIGGMSELLVDSIEHASHDLGISPFFAGAFVVAIVGNAAEHYVAVAVAARDKMDLAFGIAVGSSVQIGLFVTPLLALVSFVLGPGPMALVLNGYEIAGLIAAALIAFALSSDGESTWLEGLQLIAVYTVIALVSFYA